MYLPLKDGKKAAMPRYFKDKLYSSDQRELVKNHQQAIILDREFKEIADKGYNEVKTQFKRVQKHSADAVNNQIKQNRKTEKL